MQRVDAAIGELGRDARLRGIVTPADARVVGIGRVGVVAMGELGHHQPDRPEIPARHHRPHVAHQRIARIAVVHRADPPRRLGHADQVLAFLDGHRHWFLAQHVKAGLEERFRDRVMGGVRRRDGDQVDPVLARAFSRQHVAPVAIGPVCRQPQPLPIGAPRLGTVIQRPGDEVELPVDRRAQPVRRPDLAALAAADQSPLQSTHDPPSAILRALALRYRQGSAFVERDARATRTVLSEDFFCFAFRL